MQRRLKAVFLILVLVLGFSVLSLGGCAKEKPQKLIIGLLPINDSLPFWVAEQKGYFKAEGVDVELQVFKSALDRDSALQAKAVDGAIGDILAVAALNQSGVPVKITSLSLGSTPKEGRFAILVPPNSKIDSVDKLKGVEIAISPNSIIEYVTDRLLTGAGLAPQDIKKTVVADIPVRFQMLLSGQVKAATLPDPMAALAETKGARVIIDDTKQNLSQTVIFFRQETIDQKAKGIEKMFKAYVKAVNDINANPETYRPLLEEKARLPKGLLSYKIDTFPLPQLPKKEEVEGVITWMADKGILKTRFSYEQLVDNRFVKGK